MKKPFLLLTLICYPGGQTCRPLTVLRLSSKPTDVFAVLFSLNGRGGRFGLLGNIFFLAKYCDAGGGVVLLFEMKGMFIL